MSRPAKGPLEPWQLLQTSADLLDDLWQIYDIEFMTEYTAQFDLAPTPIDLEFGVMNTARAYVFGKWAKSAENSVWLKKSGAHLIGAGLSARKLSYQLGQLSKSKRAIQAIQNQLHAALESETNRPYALKTYKSATLRTGPQSQLEVIRELVSTLEDAIGELVPLPDDKTDKEIVAWQAVEFVNANNSTKEKPLPKNHAVEAAARVFRTVWNEFSTVPYQRGRYDQTIGGYDSKAGVALHKIIAKLDSNVALSLAGTAIENVRKQS
jgi:hypothetical protein